MKKSIITILAFFFFTNFSFSQELEPNALVIKDKFNYGYENTIKKYALIKWKDDFSNGNASILYNEGQHYYLLIKTIK
jgi:hypothetical protein